MAQAESDFLNAGALELLTLEMHGGRAAQNHALDLLLVRHGVAVLELHKVDGEPENLAKQLRLLRSKIDLKRLGTTLVIVGTDFDARTVELIAAEGAYLLELPPEYWKGQKSQRAREIYRRLPSSTQLRPAPKVADVVSTAQARYAGVRQDLDDEDIRSWAARLQTRSTATDL